MGERLDVFDGDGARVFVRLLFGRFLRVDDLKGSLFFVRGQHLVVAGRKRSNQVVVTEISMRKYQTLSKKKIENWCVSLAAVVIENFDFDGFVWVSGAEVVHPPLGGPPHRRQVVLDHFAPAHHHKVPRRGAAADDVKGVALPKKVLQNKSTQHCCCCTF